MQTPVRTGREFSGLRVAIVHYWFVSYGGGERFIEALAEIFPQADLFTLIAEPSTLAPILQDKKLHTSFLQHLPLAKKFHRHFLFLMPLALEQFDLSGYDLVISSESGPAKGVITSSKTCHICYCHSPMRSIWEMYPEHRRGMGAVVRPIFTLAAHYMRLWDQSSAARVDFFVANSQCSAARIRKYYRRECTVIHPPVDSIAARPSDAAGTYYLAVGRLVDYKRFDLAVSACARLGAPLKVIGVGPRYKALRRMAGVSVEFLGQVSEDELRSTIAGCRALLFPGEEDFGIVPVEVQSYGRPVIAYACGGALETVRGVFANGLRMENPTGLFFAEQSEHALIQAIRDFEAMETEFCPQTIRRHALQFDREIFKQKFSDFVRWAMTEFLERAQPEDAFSHRGAL